MDKNVDLFYDLVDSACMVLYDELKLDYISALSRVSKDLNEGIDEKMLSAESTASLEKIYEDISNHNFLNEEIRLALGLLIVKGLKHLNYPLGFITPDFVNYLFAYIINMMAHKDFRIMDVTLKTGNLLFTISNFVNYECELIGIENDELMLKIARLSSEFLNTELKIYYNKLLEDNYEQVDFIVGELDSKRENDVFLPYAIINKYLSNLCEDAFFLFLVDNDFFSQKEIATFKKDFSCTLCGLIVLPEGLFRNNHVGKSILIGTKATLRQFEMLVINFPDYNNRDEMKKMIDEIKKWIMKLKGMIK